MSDPVEAGHWVLARPVGETVQSGCDALAAECLDLFIEFPRLHRTTEDRGVQFCPDTAEALREGVDPLARRQRQHGAESLRGGFDPACAKAGLGQVDVRQRFHAETVGLVRAGAVRVQLRGALKHGGGVACRFGVLDGAQDSDGRGLERYWGIRWG
jgi:hypothetical protein